MLVTSEEWYERCRAGNVRRRKITLWYNARVITFRKLAGEESVQLEFVTIVKPHVIVFANTFPDYSRFSEDQLIVREIIKPSYSAREMAAPGVPKVPKALNEELALFKHEEKVILVKLRETREKIKACQAEIKERRAKQTKRSHAPTAILPARKPQCVAGITFYIESNRNIRKRIKRDKVSSL